MADPSIRLRPVVEDDLAMFRRFATEPGLIGLDWAGFRDAQAPARRFATDGYLGPDDGRLMVDVDQERVAAGFVSWHAGSFGGTAKHWEVGIALLPEWRGQGIGWRAQAMLCDYLFTHTPVNGFRPAPIRRTSLSRRRWRRPGSGWRAWCGPASSAPASWRDGYLYSRLRDYAGFCPGPCAPVAAIHLGLPSPAGSSGLPADSGGQPSSARASRTRGGGTLLGLAPGGVYLAATVTRRAGELLPHRFTLTGTVQQRRRSVFCGTFPRVAPGCR